MGKRKYASTRIKGEEPRVRFNQVRRDDGSFVGELAMGGILVDAEGNEVPVVMNRIVFQCSHEDRPDWQGVVGTAGFAANSVQVRCDVCRHTVRIPEQDLGGLAVLAYDRDFRIEYEGAIGIGMHDNRPGAAYVIVNLKAAERLIKIWRERLAADRAADDEDESM